MPAVSRRSASHDAGDRAARRPAAGIRPRVVRDAEHASFPRRSRRCASTCSSPRTGSRWPALCAADFEVSDNGVPQQVDLVSFDQIPLNVILALDMSDSVAGERLGSPAQRRRGAARGVEERRIRRRSSRFSHLVGARRRPDERPRRRCGARSTRAGRIGDTALVDGTYAGSRSANRTSAGRW